MRSILFSSLVSGHLDLQIKHSFRYTIYGVVVVVVGVYQSDRERTEPIFLNQ